MSGCGRRRRSLLEAIDANLANYAIRHPDHCARSFRQEPAAMTQADRDALIRLLADLVADERSLKNSRRHPAIPGRADRRRDHDPTTDQLACAAQ